jgi:hypothetical protein
MTHNSFLCTYFYFLTLYMFRAHRAHHQERQIVSIQPLITVTLCWWPCRVQVGSSLPTCTRHNHRQLPEVVLTQFVPPDDEHDVLETCRKLKNKSKYIERNCGSRWSFIKNHYVMHGQQNVKIADVVSPPPLFLKFAAFGPCNNGRK